MLTSAKGKQDRKNLHRYFSLTLFEFWYERNDNFFSQKNYLQKQPVADVLSKNLFLKLSQYSQKKHLKAWRPATLLKRDSKTGVFPVTIGQFLRTLFLQHISVGCFSTLNGWIFYVLTFHLLDLIAALRNQAPMRRFE